MDFVRNPFAVARRTIECYGFGEMLAPNHKGRWTNGGSHGDDTESDGACLTGPQPYTGEETRVPPVSSESEALADRRKTVSSEMLPVPLECGLEP